MTIEDVLNLSKSGFTADEIKKFMGFNGETKPNETKPNEIEDVFKESLSTLSKEIADLKKTMQATNILNSNGTPPEQESVNDILKSIINPTFEK